MTHVSCPQLSYGSFMEQGFWSSACSRLRPPWASLGSPLSSPLPQEYPSPQGHCFGCCTAPFPFQPDFPTACSTAWPCPRLSVAPWVPLGAEECGSAAWGLFVPVSDPGGVLGSGCLAQRQTLGLSPSRQAPELSPPRQGSMDQQQLWGASLDCRDIPDYCGNRGTPAWFG